MLIEFRVENHRSLKTEQVLTMEAGRVDGDATVPRTVPGYSKPLLPVAALYGANASGKSNVLSAMAYMCAAVLNSHRRWDPEMEVIRDPFAWGVCRTLPSMYECTFVHDGTRYRYGFTISNLGIDEEWLHAWPRGKQQTWFERERNEYTFGSSLKGERRTIQEVTRGNSLFLSAAMQHGHRQLGPIASWFYHMNSIGLDNPYEDQPGMEIWQWVKSLEDLSMQTIQVDETEVSIASLMDDITNLLRKTGVGITDIKLQRSPSGRIKDSTFLLKHENDADAWLPLESESKGTKTMFTLGFPLWSVLRNGGVLLVDELEASLHPKLAIEIIKQFNNPKTNPKNAQLIFTTHDTNLLGNDAGEPVLRRDQVWLTEKDKEGATTLYPLTDFKPRKAENVERGYLQGRYGAIPYLGNFSLLGKDAT